MASIFYRGAWANFLVATLPFGILIIIVFAIVMSGHADANSPVFYIGIALMVLGWALLVRAKWDQIRRGDLWTFGISAAHPEMRGLYRTSYVVMIVGWLAACLSGAIH